MYLTSSPLVVAVLTRLAVTSVPLTSICTEAVATWVSRLMMFAMIEVSGVALVLLAAGVAVAT